ncbi:TPA: hypothetical protein N0F65_011130, partial [Lagenidium giganteum]
AFIKITNSSKSEFDLLWSTLPHTLDAIETSDVAANPANSQRASRSCCRWCLSTRRLGTNWQAPLTSRRQPSRR